MWTCIDDDIEWTFQCCLCGSVGQVVYCPACGHNFCDDCKRNYYRRGLEAVKTLLGQTSLYCGGGRHG